MVEVEVGVVMFEGPMGIPEEETNGPVEIPEETPDVGVVGLVNPIGTTDGELEMVGTDLGILVRTTSGMVAVDAVEGLLETGVVALIEATGEPEETAIPKVVGEAEEALEMGKID